MNGVETQGRASAVRSTRDSRQSFLVFVGEMLREGKFYENRGRVGLRLGRSKLEVARDGSVVWTFDDKQWENLRPYPGDSLGQYYLAELIRTKGEVS